MKARRSYKKLYCSLLIPVLCIATLFAGHTNGGAVETMASVGNAYESLLFDTSLVHSIDIKMDDWQGFLDTCTDETYTECDVTIDGEFYQNVAIRAKGNTSLTQVARYGNDRYSFKIEFDHYSDACRYHGLDKLSLNNIIQDNTYMKDYLTYQMMGYFGVAAPLCSFVYITVNGEDWGLYLAVEGVEDAFLARNYGKNPGNLYKPDSMNMGGGKGFGRDFRMEEWDGNETPAQNKEMPSPNDENDMPPAPGDGFEDSPDGKHGPGGFDGGPDSDRGFGSDPDSDHGFGGGPGSDHGFDGDHGNGGFGGGPGMIGSSDTSLIYSDDDYDSYENIFENAKTDLSDEDKNRLICALKDLNAGDNLTDAVDIDQVIRYFVVHNFVCNFDSYTGSLIHNYYLYEEDGKLSMIPWDYNLAFGGFEASMDATAIVNYPIDTPVSGGSVDSRPMLAWIFADEDYTELYHQYFSEFIASFFENGIFEETIDEAYALIAPYVEKDPTKFCTYDEFETGVDTLKNLCLLRAKSVRGQLEGTIPANSEEQAADSFALIDASGLLISDMGAMEQNHGGKSGGFPDRHQD